VATVLEPFAEGKEAHAERFSLLGDSEIWQKTVFHFAKIFISLTPQPS
jgi:hypothetical protein